MGLGGRGTLAERWWGGGKEAEGKWAMREEAVAVCVIVRG